MRATMHAFDEDGARLHMTGWYEDMARIFSRGAAESLRVTQMRACMRACNELRGEIVGRVLICIDGGKV